MSKIKLSKEFIRSSVKLALNEDLYPLGDITSSLINNDKTVTVKLLSNQKAIVGGLLFAKQTFALIDSKIIEVKLISNENAVIGGLRFAKYAFALIDNKIKFIAKKKDGSFVKKNSLIAIIKGKAKNILIAERVALNFLSHISGIATKTNEFVKLSKI